MRAEASDQADRGEAPESGWRERGRLASDLDPAVLSRWNMPDREHLEDVRQRVAAGMEPDPQRPDHEAESEERRQDPPPATLPAEESCAASDQQQSRVAEREPGMPGLAEHLAVLEAQLGQEERRAAQHGRDHPLVQAPLT